MIKGTKILLTGLSKSSFSFIYECVNDPDLKNKTGTLFPVSEYEHEKWMESKALNKEEKIFVIKDKESLIDVGTIGLKHIDYINSNAELYITISKSYQKKGYGKSSIIALVNFCFLRMNLHKIYLKVFSNNIDAIKTYEKCGFKIEGKLVDHHYDEGKYCDVFIMSIIRKENKNV